MSRRFYIGIDNGLNGSAVLLDAQRMELPIRVVASARRHINGKGNILEYEAMRKAIISMIEHAKAELGNPTKLTKDLMILCEEPVLNIRGKTSKEAIASTQGTFHLLSTLLFEMQDKYGVAIQTLTPQKWQKTFWAARGDKTTKELSIAHAKAIFSGVDFRKSERAVNAHDGMTDAALVAEYARRNQL